MSRIHYFQRYSSVENTVTNNTLQLFGRIYEYSARAASRLLSELTGQAVYIGIEIAQQNRSSTSVPDGTIIQSSFKIAIEAKVDRLMIALNKENLGVVVHVCDFEAIRSHTNEPQTLTMPWTDENLRSVVATFQTAANPSAYAGDTMERLQKLKASKFDPKNA